MKWALVIWLINPSNFTVSDRYQTLEECLDRRQVMVKAFNQVDSEYRAVCRPISPHGEVSRSNIIIHKYTVY